MTKNNVFSRLMLGGSAVQALALLGAGVGATVMTAAPAAAQDFTNVTASGRVQGTDGQAIAGATVVLRSNDQGVSRTVTTDSGGSFSAAQLPPGTYTFTITANGFETFTDSAVTLSQAGAANQFTLAPSGGASTGDIVITAGRVATPDFTRTTTGSVINIGELQTRVPVARTLRDVILLAPGVTPGSSSPSAGGNAAAFNAVTQINGSSATENAYFVNGLNITEVRSGFAPVTVPFDFYQTVEVKTGGFPAEFGRATGGFINAVTKSGSNTFHGSMLFNWEPNALRQHSPNTRIADNDFAKSNRVEAIAQLSGPIIKDRLFFYGLYNARSVETRTGNNTSTASFQSTKSPFWGAKIDAIPINGQHLEFTYFDTSVTTYNTSYVYTPSTNVIGRFGARTVALAGGKNWVGRYTGTFTNWLTISAAYGKNRNRGATLPADTVNGQEIDARTVTTGQLLPGTNTASTTTIDTDVRTFYRGDIDLTFHLAGSHHIRAGYDREDINSTRVQTPIAGGAATINLCPAGGCLIASGSPVALPAGTTYVGRRFFTVGGTFTTRNDAFYIQDDWGLFDNRLRLQLGVRDDRFNLKNGVGQNFYKSGDQWGPHVGFSFDPLGNGKAKIFGSFTRNFTPIPSNTNLRSAGVQFDRTSYFLFGGLDANGRIIYGAPITGAAVSNGRACPDTGVTNCRIISSGSTKPPEAIVSSTLKSQYDDEFILGAEYRMGSHVRVGLEGTYRRLGRAAEDMAIDQAAIAYCISKGFTAAACNSNYSGFSQYVIANPGDSLTVQLRSDNTGVGLPPCSATVTTAGCGTSPTVTFTPQQLGITQHPRRKYYAVTAKFDRDFDGKWSLSASYTWSQLKGDYEGGAKSDIAQVDTGITEDYDQPGFLIGAYGYLPGHRRHTFKVYGSYQIGEWLTLGANALIQSPKKFGCLGIVPATIDPFANAYGPAGHFCQGVVVPRGSVFESDWRKEVSMTAQIRLPVDFDASLRFDVFNIFNSKAVLERDEVGDTAAGGVSPTYKQATGYEAPRSARVQVRVGF